MLQIKEISKQYRTGDLIQDALSNVSINLCDNEFVAILGPSGSGKTTLLNIIGGLDRYDSGDLVINSISTKKYKDRDWDSYRNHTIGFVFQSYNLIPHQSILSNVELALTISGISRSERQKRAKRALTQVGLVDQCHKKPNQMSGGQMQRVAIARALVNSPDILLADEPTGALDSETSVQVMELLKEVAKDRLVVMVTHNAELAERYATRIIRLRDGRVIDDSAPLELDTASLKEPEHKNMGRSSMSFLTSLSLSFHNLLTKKARTLLTSFAGSIGIIGIALILALSTGVNAYITDIQKSTMTSYPITIESQSFDMNRMIAGGGTGRDKDVGHELDGVYVDGEDLERQFAMAASIKENNLTEFKKYLDNESSEIRPYIGENGIVYSYATKFRVFSHDPEDVLVNSDGSTLTGFQVGGMGIGTGTDRNMGGSVPTGMSMGKSNNFEEMLPGSNGAFISPAITESYEVLHGNWPTAYNEVMLVLDIHNEISASSLYELGLLPSSEYRKLMEKIQAGEKITLEQTKWNYMDIAEQAFYLIPECDLYVKGGKGLYEFVGGNAVEIEKLIENAMELKVSGVIRPKEDAKYASIKRPIAYTKALTDYIIAYTDESDIVKAQLASPDVNVLSGVGFSPADDATRIADTKTYISNMGLTGKANLSKDILGRAYARNPEMAGQMMTMGEGELAAMLDDYLDNSDDDVLLSIYESYISTGSYDENMEAFGVVSLDAPDSINIYADSFEDKDAIAECIKAYNKTVSEENNIFYNDYAALLMSTVTTIVDVISYVLIAFVSVSLVVSSIMIGIITYISVLERTKEIGILRAIGASKRNISQVFNAETLIVGLCSGLLGVGISALLLIPGNAVIHAVTESTGVNAVLPVTSAAILVVLSMILTLIGGFIPSKKAARKDPVTALRTE